MSAASGMVFVGAGNMAAAMVAGLLAAGAEPASLFCVGGPGGSGGRLAAATGISEITDPEQVPTSVDCVVLAVKPQRLPALDPRWARVVEGRLLVSVLAGTTLEGLRRQFPQARGIVRAMPNTPGKIGCGITGLSPELGVAATDLEAARRLLGGLGALVEVAEERMDALTAVSGSGPAYVFEFCAALRAAGIAAGLEAAVADQLARATIAGAGRLLEASAEDPERLRAAVTSPGGTTAEGLRVLAEADFRGLVGRVVAAAAARSRELSVG